jgi:hypothetical protein
MTDPNPTVTVSVSDTVQQSLALATEAKAGYKTTEFWMKIAALGLTIAFCTGLIPATGSAERIAEIAALVLSSLGYTVCRSWVKAS